MKKSKFLLPLYLAVFGFAGTAIAGDCVISYDRTACAGQEKVAYAKCDGNKTCDKAKPADTQEACMANAMNACANDRVDITKSKKIVAKFNGAALVGGFNDAGDADPKGANFCAKARPDFNKCP
ncbi:MAG: hypothetical protein HQL94_01910 [Magnetococcales bacterium]|nr:hypothetical protein [Magnetococcales bacterium]MBF0438968.1 hypothetical protein [Magnetococcales bacterium]